MVGEKYEKEDDCCCCCGGNDDDDDCGGADCREEVTFDEFLLRSLR